MLRTIGEVNPLPSALTRLARSVLTLGLLVLVKESDANTTQKWPDRDLYTPKSQYIYYRVHKWVELYWTSVGKQASEKRIDSFLKHHLHNHLGYNNLVVAKLRKMVFVWYFLNQYMSKQHLWWYNLNYVNCHYIPLIVFSVLKLISN